MWCRLITVTVQRHSNPPAWCQCTLSYSYAVSPRLRTVSNGPKCDKHVMKKLTQKLTSHASRTLLRKLAYSCATQTSREPSGRRQNMFWAKLTRKLLMIIFGIFKIVCLCKQWVCGCHTRATSISTFRIRFRSANSVHPLRTTVLLMWQRMGIWLRPNQNGFNLLEKILFQQKYVANSCCNLRMKRCQY